MPTGSRRTAETPRPPTDALAGAAPNLRHLFLLQACARLGSVTRAAAALGVTQPAASQALARLDTFYGQNLLDRQVVPARATEAGRAVLARVARLDELIRGGTGRTPGTAAQLTVAHLKAVAAVAEGGGFSAAARLLGQAEPSVHRSAREAEAVLGQALFDGRGASVRLSPDGRRVARWMRLALNEIESAAADLRERAGEFSAKLRIGTLPLARASLVPDAVARLVARFPDARLTISEGAYEGLVSDLEMGRIDLLVGALRAGGTSRRLEQRELTRYRLAVVARRGHPLSGRRAGPGDLARFAWIAARVGTPSREVLATLAARFPKDRPMREMVETGSLVVARGLMLRTDCLTLLSEEQVRYEIEAGYLEVIDAEVPDPGRPFGVTLRRNWMPTPMQAAFLAELEAAARGG